MARFPAPSSVAVFRLGSMVAETKGHRDHVTNAGEDSEGHSNVEAELTAFGDPVVAVNLVQQHEQHSKDLGYGVGLTQQAGLKDFHGAAGIEQAADDHDDDVAAENQDGHSQGDLVSGKEHQEHGAEQKLVGNGVQILAECGLLFHQAGQQSVQAVGNPGNDEDSQGPAVVAAQNGNHDERQKDQAQQ